jgi:hypothetical protein
MLLDSGGVWLTEVLAHRVGRFGGVLLVDQAPLLDGLALDAFALEQDGLPPSKVDIGRVQDAWSGASEWDRSSEFLQALAAVLGFDDSQVDQMFRDAAAIQI